ncbi:MAG: mechanosensitive ion channel family protein [Zoogloeaceae bacterium]|jgi:miniconductance mechanosensitive channel|nr:mechanosensitive ion channel family protein [Zoogloeaceae bacterium]
MENFIDSLEFWAQSYPAANAVVVTILLCLLSWMANWITKRILLRAVRHWVFGTFFGMHDGEEQEEAPMRAIERLSNVVPALVISLGVIWIPHLPEGFVSVVKNVCNAFIILTLSLAVGRGLDWFSEIYHRHADYARRPIKGYIQLVKIGLYVVTAILIVASLMDRSPLILLSGLGAMAAVLMLIFQDTILSLVASVQLNSNDMLRVGDWIEMPNLNVDGEVVDIALHTVKVQNWDKTISTIPTKRLISDAFKNWRGMSESGGRRIKRPLFIDQRGIRFLSKEHRQRLEKMRLIEPYLQDKDEELKSWNAQLAGADEVNYRRLTNIGTFRAYVVRYLKHHPNIHQDMTLLVRQLNPSPEGLPIEIYCFTNTTAWGEYEDIQSDIFDHLLATLPDFGLSIFQQPTGGDLARAFSSSHGEKESGGR